MLILLQELEVALQCNNEQQLITCLQKGVIGFSREL